MKTGPNLRPINDNRKYEVTENIDHFLIYNDNLTANSSISMKENIFSEKNVVYGFVLHTFIMWVTHLIDFSLSLSLAFSLSLRRTSKQIFSFFSNINIACTPKFDAIMLKQHNQNITRKILVSIFFS